GYLWLLPLSAFFFQAEDGIRDFHVTGVQTCALPIYLAALPGAAAGGALAWLLGGFTGGALPALLSLLAGSVVGGVVFFVAAYALRIEEVRVFLETARAKALRR